MKNSDWLKAAAVHLKSMRQVDKELADFDDFSMHHLVLAYLLLSCLYYDYNESAVSDETYDWLCEYLRVNFDLIDTMHDYMDKEMLKAGTAFHLFRKFPRGIEHMAISWTEYTRSKR